MDSKAEIFLQAPILGVVLQTDVFYSFIYGSLNLRVFFFMFGVHKKFFCGADAFFSEDFCEVAGAFFKQSKVSGQDADEV